MPHLLNISIGPVQEFIASARRAQDLWYGSWLLSDLSKEAAKVLADEGATIIFPGGLAQGLTLPEDASVANKILAVIDQDGDGVRNLAEAARKAMKQRLTELAHHTLDRVYRGLEGEEVLEARKLAEAQIEGLMEFQWVAVPVTGDYTAARGEAERLLNAVKNTKTWSQPGWARVGWRKSSLDGIRETAIPDRFFEQKEKAPAPMPEEELYAHFRVRKTERLCGVGLLKRWGTEPESQEAPRRFHSTSHMAAAPLRSRAAKLAGDPAVQQAWESYRDLLSRAPFRGRQHIQGAEHTLFKDYDGSVLYPNRLRDIFFGGEDPRKITGLHIGNCKEAEEALQHLLNTLGLKGEPTPHYALLLADGDHMGAAIDNQGSVEQHQAISQALDDFARNVRKIVGEHGGSLIYSGGDDVLALLPLHTCLRAAKALADDFRARLEKFPTAEGKVPTLSAGLAIAHHLEDFADVRVWAQQAEKLAKKERNSLAIRLEKRGGSPVEITGKWDSGFLERLEEWVERHAAGEVPNKLPFQWEELILLAQGNEQMNPVVMEDARRLVRRKDSKQAGTKPVDHILTYLKDHTDPAVLKALSNELVVAREIERACRQASVKETN